MCTSDGRRCQSVASAARRATASLAGTCAGRRVARAVARKRRCSGRHWSRPSRPCTGRKSPLWESSFRSANGGMESENSKDDSPSTETWNEWCSPCIGENVTLLSSKSRLPISTGCANCSSLRKDQSSAPRMLLVGARFEKVGSRCRSLEGGKSRRQLQAKTHSRDTKVTGDRLKRQAVE